MVGGGGGAVVDVQSEGVLLTSAGQVSAKDK